MAILHLIGETKKAVEERIDEERIDEERIDEERKIIGSVEEDDSSQAAISQIITNALDNNEVGDAMLFLSLFKGKYCFDHADQQWYRYEEHYWMQDDVRSVLRDLDQVVLMYKQEEEHLSNKHNRKRNKELRLRLRKRIRELQTLHRRKHVLELSAAGIGSLGITGQEWDRNPSLLGCQNGVLQLRTYDLRPGSPGDYIKTFCPTLWVSLEQDAPAFLKFIRDIFGGNTELIRFVQRLFGYAINGTLTEHIFPILYGIGRNGKGTLLETIKAVLGPFAGPVQPEMLLEQRWKRSSAAPSPDIMALKGRRIVWGSETDEGNYLDISKVKRLVGGDTLTGRPLYGKREICFSPTHTLFLLTNHKPRVQSDDFAFWQRVHLIPFNVSFVDNPCGSNEQRRDPDLPEKLRQESSGILAWLVRGLAAYRYAGLNPPNVVRAATEDYRADEDLLGKFISERCVCEETSRVDAGRIYEGYQDWAKENGFQPVSSHRFSKYLRGRGFERDDSGRHRGYLGIELA